MSKVQPNNQPVVPKPPPSPSGQAANAPKLPPTLERAIDTVASRAGGALQKAADAFEALASRAPAALSQLAKTTATEGLRALQQVPTGGVTAASPTTLAPRGEPVVREMTFVFDAGPHGDTLSNFQLKGSFDKQTGKFDANWGGGDTVPMTYIGDGKYAATVKVSDDGQPRDWKWGVVADGPTGKGQWAVFGESALSFNPRAKPDQVSYAPTSYHRMGATKQENGDASFRYWAPNAKEVAVKVVGQDGSVERLPMTREADGTWDVKVAGGWERMEGKAFSYELVDSRGERAERPDPYSRVMQGEQRGIGRVYIDPRSGNEVNAYHVQGDLKAELEARWGRGWDAIPWPEREAVIKVSRTEMARFDVQKAGNESEAELVFFDESGRQLGKAELLERIGAFDSSLDPALADKLRGGRFDDLWSRNLGDDGAIKMVRQGDAWGTIVNNPEKLVGLRYEFRTYETKADGSRVWLEDTNGDGKLGQAERVASAKNDDWSNLITEKSGTSFRNGIITDPNAYVWKNDDVPRETDSNKWVVKQIHVGSLMGDAQNTQRSTYKDVIEKLQYFKDLGINTLEVMPANEFEGSRDWGYMGANTLAIESAYGFEDENGQWVNGAEALKRFIDEAHGLGMNVINDVVYNHVGGNSNHMWQTDGPENPYFNWSKEAGGFEQRDTDWGPMPAYNRPQVKQFFVDHAVAQVQEFKFDGLRFDFTGPMKDDRMGGKAGWEMMREMNRQLHFLNPDVVTMAEQFDYDPNITRPAEADGKGGGGFDAQWYTEYQHRLVNDHGNPSILQQAVAGERTNMDAFMGLLTDPRGLSSWSAAVSVISNHDEVGNASRTVTVANGGEEGFPGQMARNMARFAAGMGFASPGIPMFFQGDESMAQNRFSWGIPSTWDQGWDWESVGPDWNWDELTFNDAQKATYERLFSTLPEGRTREPEYQRLNDADRQVFEDLAAMSPADRDATMLNIARKQTHAFFQDSIALRQSSPAFAADAELNRVYTHNDDSVLAFTRKSGDEEFLVIGSLNGSNLEGYKMPIPGGAWAEVHNSDAAAYGGGNFGNYGGTIYGGDKQSVNIPAGGYIVLKKVG